MPCSTHAPLTSIAVAPPAPPPPSQHVQQPAAGPFRAFEDVLGTQRHQQQQHRQQQQQLEQLVQAAADMLPQTEMGQQHNTLQQPLVLDQQQQQDGAAALEQLTAAAKWRLQLGTQQLQQLLHQVQPLLPRLKPGQLANTAHAVSVLPHGPAAAAGLPGWQDGLLAAAGQLFSAGRMDEWASSVLLQAMARLGAQPGPSWLHAACAGMDVAGWKSSRALATVAAVLPQLGHVPSSSWAAAYFTATDSKLQDMPAVSLARMLHGVVAWHHLQQQQQQQRVVQQQDRQQEQQQQQVQEQDFQQHVEQGLVLPNRRWLASALQQLHACSSELKPCELAMVLQSLSRLQQTGYLCYNDLGGGSSNGRSRSRSSQLVQVYSQRLLRAVLPAVALQQQHFGSQDLAVVLHSLALLVQQGQQGGGADGLSGVAQQLCSWEWLEQVLPAVQVRW